MSHHEQDDHSFDQAMRRLHMQAVDQVSPATRTRLRVARQAATTPAATREHRRGSGWMLATGFAAVSALAIGLMLRPSPQAPGVTSPAPAVAAASPAAYDADTALATLDENPDLYLWLASNDDAMPALDP
jgi:hypothetical protein